MNIPKLRLKQISVFAVVSCLVYLITAIESGPSIGEQFKLFVFIEGKVAALKIPYLWIPITIFLTVIAMRLYLHAWAVDESPAHKRIREISGGKFNFKLLLEWIFRVLWVLMVTYLPSVYSKKQLIVVNVTISWELYFALLFFLIIIWDILMINYIIEFSHYVNKDNSTKSQNIKDLRRTWFHFDLYLFGLTLFNFLINIFEWQENWLNYKPYIFLVLLTIMMGICFTQIIKWGIEIYYSITNG